MEASNRLGMWTCSPMRVRRDALLYTWLMCAESRYIDMDPSILDILRSTDVAVRVAIVSSTTVATKAL